MKISGAQAIVTALEQEGLEVVFGIPGVQTITLYNAFCDSSIRSVLATHELSASFMALGYAWATGKVGVCIAIPGPGLTNMITGLAEARCDSSPVVALVSGKKNNSRSFAIHQVDQQAVLKPIAKSFLKIENKQEISKIIHQAFKQAISGGPGPVIVEIASEVYTQTLTESDTELEFEDREIDSVSNEKKLESIAKLLSESKLCGIYAGCGCFGASGQLRQLANLLSAPVSTTVSGRGVMPEDDDLCLGFGFSAAGTEIAQEIFARCDTILAIGCKFSEMSTGAWSLNIPENLIHIDTDDEVFNKNYRSGISLTMPAQDALSRILELLSGLNREPSYLLKQEIKAAKQKYSAKIEQTHLEKAVHPAYLLHQLRNILERDAILVTDCGNHQLWAISDFSVFAPRTFITPADYQSMGFGVPVSIAAKIAHPKRQVVCICGDGGFLMSGFELLTAVREGLNPVVVIFKDNALGLIKRIQQMRYARTNSTDLINPNYELLAKSFGVEYVNIVNNQMVIEALTSAVSKNKPVIVEVGINYRDTPKYIEGIQKAHWQELAFRKRVKLILDIGKRWIQERVKV